MVHVPGSGRQGLCSPCPRSPRRRCGRLQRDLNRIQVRVELFARVCVFLLPCGRHGVGEHCLLTGAKDGVFGTCSLKLLSILFCWGIHRGRRRDWHRAARLAGLKFGCLLKDSARDWELSRTLGALPPLSELALPGEVHIHVEMPVSRWG